jgi:para-nitrobenzyl esterase
MTMTATDDLLVQTKAGELRGARENGVAVFRGVPYAAAPVGDLRFKPPQPMPAWPGVREATTDGPIAPQGRSRLAHVMGDFELPQSEDCLTLNIWTPAAATPSESLPVLVFLHPGSFLAASSNLAPIDGQRFASERRAVVVAPNYRLGPFGFLAHSALTIEDPNYRSSGNYGLADQREALRWIRQNISAFGGDGARVALAGTSAGAISTSLHLISPLSRGLFQRAIMQSGFATTRLYSAIEAEAQGDALAAALGCTDRTTVLACLRSKSRDEVLGTLPLTTLTGGFQQFTQEPGRVIWAPVVDGLEVPDQPRELYRRGLFSRVPIVIGTNRDEGWTFVDRSFPSGLDAVQYDRQVRTEFGIEADAILRLYPSGAFPSAKDALARLTTDAEFTCEARRIARVMHHDGAPVYLYSLEYAIDPVNPGRAFHGLDSNLIFGNNFGPPSNYGLTTPDLALYDTMSTFWRRFANTGDPNVRGVPEQWPAYETPPMADASRANRHFVFANRLGVAADLRDAPCNFWEGLFLRSVLGAVPAATR